ncbi:MAG: hypothetical protein Rubg2KO_07700 [Rubricoccaceae bacterium]
MIRQFVAAILVALPLGAAAQSYVPAHERDQGIETGTELVMVYIGASHCGPCIQPDYKAALEQAKLLLAEQAEAAGHGFAVIGVSIDYSADVGFQFLKESGGFDELVIGRNWFNSLALSHFGVTEGQEPRQLALPSVILYERDMTLAGSIRASEPRYIRQVAGGVALPEWVAAGAPLTDPQ